MIVGVWVPHVLKAARKQLDDILALLPRIGHVKNHHCAKKAAFMVYFRKAVHDSTCGTEAVLRGA